MRRTIQFLLQNSLFLIVGALLGLIWANWDPAGYEQIARAPLFGGAYGGQAHEGRWIFSLHFLTNNVLMALFFGIAGKEVWESMLPHGSLHDPRKAATPLIATLGGMIGPASIYVLGTLLLGQWEALGNGWAIPCATDVAFSYMLARLIFGRSHAAISFLLLLAIADDALGLIILALFYPQEEVALGWLLLAAAAVVIGLLFRRFHIRSFWPYLLIPGTLSWIGFAYAGIHPALALIPVIPTMPHARSDTGWFEQGPFEGNDTLTAFEVWWRNPVELILGLFGFLNAGVTLGSVGTPTYLVLAALLAGKPLGIMLCGMLAARTLRFGLPHGMNPRDLFVVGCAAGIGFTVALFIATVAFPAGAVQDAAKMGALGSLGAGILTFAAAKILGVARVEDTDPSGSGGDRS